MKMENPSQDAAALEGGLTRHILVNPSIAGASALAKSWLDQCASSHTRCKEILENDRHPIPKRVIAVGGEDNNSIHIFEPGEKSVSNAPYVALSHCWGLSQHLISKRSTIADWKQKIPFFKLPKTFREAIAITRALGIQYIWIDSLCIVQDDPHDWEVEAEKMGAIYHNARLVIAATASKDGDGGMLFSRTGHATISGRDQNDNSFQIFVRRRCDHAAFSWGRNTSSSYGVGQSDPVFASTFPLLTRAWCFQERILGTRVLHFTNDEMVFECSTSINCECGAMDGFSDASIGPLRQYVASRPQDRVESTSTSTSPIILRSAAQAFPIEPFTLSYALEESTEFSPVFMDWRSLVSEYSKKGITRSSDWLPALAGLASRWSTDDTGRYLAGLWSKDLFRGLLWKAVSPDPEEHTGYIAPSWSWARPRRAITWLPASQSLPKYQVEFDAQKSAVVLKGQNRFGEVLSGWLYLSGQVTEVELTLLQRLDEPMPVAYVDVGGYKQAVFVDAVQFCAQLVGQKVLWLRYCEDGGFDRALILARVPEEHRNDLPPEVRSFPLVCRRIGVVQFADKRMEYGEMKEVNMYMV
jgi:hypothetical protein